MKDLRDVKKEYGYILRWWNGWWDEAGNYYPYTFFLEDVETREITYITDQKAIDYINRKTTNAFRKWNNIYNDYVGLFEILGIERKADA